MQKLRLQWLHVHGIPIHCGNLDDAQHCLDGYRTSGQGRDAVLWLGNSQVHAINQIKPGNETAAPELHRNFQDRNVYFLTFSQPNANLQEHYVLFHYLLDQLSLRSLVLSVVFDDMHNTGIRTSLTDVVIWFFVNAIFFQNPMAFSSSLKVTLLRLFGAIIGEGVILKPGVNIKYPWNLEVGDDTWVGEKVWLDSLVKIEMGQNVCISQGAFLLTGSHNYKKTSFDLLLDKIILEDGVWIGAKAVVCPGVTCYSHSILTVNSVATTDLEPYTIYQGNPALPKRKRSMM